MESGLSGKGKGKHKGHILDIAPLSEGTSPQKRSGMARVVEGFHSFTYTPTCLSTNGMNHTCLCLPNRSWFSFSDPGRMEGWVILGTTLVSKQSAQHHYVTDHITVVSCSSRHGAHRGASNSRFLGPQAAMLTTEPPSLVFWYEVLWHLFVSIFVSASLHFVFEVSTDRGVNTVYSLEKMLYGNFFFGGGGF